MYLILVGVGVGPIFNSSANMKQNYNRYSKNLRCMVRLWIFMHLWALLKSYCIFVVVFIKFEICINICSLHSYGMRIHI